MTGQPSASPIWFQSFHCDGEDSHDFVLMKHQSSVLLFATASARHVTLRTDRRIHGLQNENGFVYHLPIKKINFQVMVLPSLKTHVHAWSTVFTQTGSENKWSRASTSSPLQPNICSPASRGSIRCGTRAATLRTLRQSRLHYMP